MTETEAARSIELEVPDDLAERFTYRPGQFLTVRVPSDETGSVARSYSLSSAPGVDDHLAVTVKRTAGGYGSNWLCDNLTPGDHLTVLAPSGRFTPRSLDDDLLLFAAGSGITPMMSIIKAAMANGRAEVTLFYASTHAEDVIFDEALRALEQQHPSRLRVQRWLDAEQGRPTRAALATLVAELPRSEVFLCGPAPFMDLVSAALAECGVERARVHREVFSSLSGNPFEDPASPVSVDAGTDPATDEEVSGVSSAVVLLDGQRHEFDWRRSHTLVEEMIARSIEVPHSCRSGECGSCLCTVRSGRVAMERSEALDPDDVANGYVLGCQARPLSEQVEVEFE